jgi:hypothetical protein
MTKEFKNSRFIPAIYMEVKIANHSIEALPFKVLDSKRGFSVTGFLLMA